MKTCEDCGDEINPKRVAARPEVETCISCQTDREAGGRFARHRMDIQATVRCGELEELNQTIVRAE